MRAFTGSAELNAMVARVAPAILGLLADGVPRPEAAIVAALAGRHAAEPNRIGSRRLIRSTIEGGLTGRLDIKTS
jgi:hypothetical protein